MNIPPHVVDDMLRKGAVIGPPVRIEPAVPIHCSERDFQADVVKLARRLGWLCYHTHDSRKSAAGFPDLVIARAQAQRLIVAELKVGRNATTPEQDDWLAAFRAGGIPAVVWRPENWPEIERALRE